MNSTFPKIVLACCLAGLASCSEKTADPVPYSYEYFPTEQGRFVIYDVDSVYHSDNDNNNDDSVYRWHFQVKEVIDSTFSDGQGRPTQRINRYRRNDTTQAWSFMNVWTQTRTSRAAYRFEDNVYFHKLSFPVLPEVSWNGNDSNTDDEETYTYDGVHEMKMVGAVSFDSTVSVLQRDDDNFVEKIYGYEIYAWNVGMVYKQRDNLRKQGGLVASGTEYKMTVNSYGKE